MYECQKSAVIHKIIIIKKQEKRRKKAQITKTKLSRSLKKNFKELPLSSLFIGAGEEEHAHITRF